MRDIYWKDIQHVDGSVAGLMLNVSSPPDIRPSIQIISGNNGRIKLVNGDNTLLWATPALGYEGIWVINPQRQTNTELPVIPPITSEDIQFRIHLAEEEKLKSWCRFFADRAAQSDSTFLYSGHWLLTALYPHPTEQYRARDRLHHNPIDQWIFKDRGPTDSHFPRWAIYGAGLLDTFSHRAVQWVDWWDWNGGVIALHQVDEYSGRLKWWRKKAREGTLPPVFVWYLRCFDAYLIMDGHYRLRAAMLEHIAAEFIVISSVNELHYAMDQERQKQIVDSLFSPRPKHKSIPVEHLNQVVMAAFDDRPTLMPVTKSRAILADESVWINEVTQYLAESGQDDDIQAIIERRG